jgi:parallel beta-helix repeat protein
VSLIIGCDNNPINEGVDLKGQIILLDNQLEVSITEYDSIFVALYPTATLDSNINNIIQIHQNIGTDFSQEIIFDHRTQVPNYIVNANSDGFFLIKGIKKGLYNLVVIKPYWSIKYIYNVEIKDNKIQDIGNLFVNKAINIKDNITNQFIFKSGQMYLIDEDINFLNDVIIEEGSYLAVKPGRTIKFYSNIESPPSGLWQINTSYNIYKFGLVNIDYTNYFNGVIIYNNDVTFSRACVKNANTALSVLGQNCYISHSNFMNSGYGILTSNVNINIDNCSFVDLLSAGVQVLGIDNDLIITDCIVHCCNDGIVIYTGGDTIIENNYISNNNIGIRPTSAHGEIKHCEFNTNYYDIFMSSSNYLVEYNNFNYSRYISIIPNSISLTSQSIISNNNFIDTHYAFISVRAGSPLYTCVISDLNAINNFWDKENIDEYLLDALDNDAYPAGQICPWKIIYIPKKQSRISSAGISG